MGCDGGTIPRRDELVRTKKKPEQKDKEAEMAYRWRYCALTQQPLQEPIVMCGLGRLYSKQSIIEYLLDKERVGNNESVAHIKSLKDVKNLQLTKNPTYNCDDNKTDGFIDVRSAPYICKLIGLEMAGKFRFVALWTCGCVFSERALIEIKSKICSLCQTAFTEADIVILNCTDEELNLMKTKLEARLARRKADKKDKKSLAAATSTSTTSTTSANVASSTITSSTENISSTIPVPVPSTLSSTESKSVNKIPINAAADTTTSSKIITPKTTTTTKTTVIKPSTSKLSTNNKSIIMKSSSVAGIAAAATLKRESSEFLIDPALKKLKDGKFSVAADPKASDVYKSIFTSHKSEKEQTRAHWVTYNPFYN